ncbi:hypothetical protein [Nostoc sp. MS1]|nr:hypothetical protein [Nostoc sp. MS1]
MPQGFEQSGFSVFGQVYYEILLNYFAGNKQGQAVAEDRATYR